MSEKQMRQNVLWNAVGSLVYALASMVLAFIVIRMAGEDEGGIFGFGFSTLGQQMFIVAYFGIRPFHITDTGREFLFRDYLRTRIISSAAAVSCTVLFVGMMWAGGSYSAHKATVLALLCAYKIVDGYADVYESELQRLGRLDLSGKSLTFRTLLSVSVLVGVLYVSGNLTLACAAAVLSQLFGLYGFAMHPHRRVVYGRGMTEQGASGSRRCANLIRQTVLLFVSVFLDFYVFSAAKYAVDQYMTDADSGFFNILFMPTSFIYLVANFLIRPLLTRLAEQWQSGNRRQFQKTCRHMQLGVAGLGVLILLAAALLGNWGLSVFEYLLGAGYAGRLTAYLPAFLLIIAGGALYALANVQYYILVTVRRQKLIFAGYGIAALTAFLLSPLLVRAGGLSGAALCYLLLMGLLLVLFTLASFLPARKQRNT